MTEEARVSDMLEEQIQRKRCQQNGNLQFLVMLDFSNILL